MAQIPSWQDEEPRNNHGAVGWTIFAEKGYNPAKTIHEAPLESFHSLTYRMLQAGKSEPAHSHETKEHVFYVIEGEADVELDGKVHKVKAGDAIHLPPKTQHRFINDSAGWLTHLAISSIVE